ncbi:MAG TPA: hypothetical protein PLE40_00170 [Candidatus Pacearchaeota archaeon]|nr:hypothetical protein [Candidatus Pacearchaeota archaeon]HOL90471.1 hypothetical protein [Candidatus Pacearchaeota archaeon]HPO68157.1 hypothetical protein [Candidatus Pacearchaeota archaeon]
MIGISLGAHYRILNSSDKIEFFLKHLLSKNLNIIELSFYDKKTYNLYFESYKNSLFLKNNKKQIHLHLPRKDWKEIGLNKIMQDIRYLDAKLDIKLLVFHYADFVKYGYKFIKYKQKIGVENDLIMHNSLKLEQFIVCDINHFWNKEKFNKKIFLDFVKNNYKQIKEFHFAYKNHNLFDKKNISWLRDIYYEVSQISNFNNVPFIFEGTNKKTNNIRTFINELNNNLSLISNVLCNKN